MFDTSKVLLLSGSSNPILAKNISVHLNKPLAAIELRKFSDGEIFIEIKENVRGCDVFIIQSTCTPVNDHMMELLIMVDTLKRSSAKSITAVIPYYGYSRQDRKAAPRTPITAKLVADLLETSGVNRVVSIDLHAGQIQGFFNIPTDNLYAMPVHIKYITENILPQGPLVVVSPDAGGAERARAYAKRLHSNMALLDKRRTSPNVAKVMNLVGNVENQIAVIVDDMVDTAGTLVEAAETLISNGAIKVCACATHGVLSGPALDRISNSKIEKVIVTDSIPHLDLINHPKIQIVGLASYLGEAIKRIYECGSISDLFI